MKDQWWRIATVGLLVGILLSQWVIHWSQSQQAAQEVAVLRSIEALLRQHNESNREILASLDELADVVDDVHAHVEGFGTERAPTSP
ncbi:MAG: hypothetical protein NZV14_01805 [Bryobacteraceae bacterium]|nr:hypothetical protein [Bryobacteraceae bacterium]MDW8376864.1 hypothetical protein [Bryobacterales bacterium]